MLDTKSEPRGEVFVHEYTRMEAGGGDPISGLWPVVLAAGSGRRLASVTGGAPKQFWKPSGRLSLLEDTLKRVGSLASRSRTTVIVDTAHESYVRAMGRESAEGQWIYQPGDRGTAAGVLLALTPVLECAPDDLVLLTPSDHGVVDLQMFRHSALEAATAIVRGIAQVVVFGTPPVTSCPDYGWIIPGALCAGEGRQIRRIVGFREKPSVAEVPALLAQRALWSTMVVVSRASTLQRLYAQRLPDMNGLFEAYRRLAPALRAGFLAAAYDTLAPADFSRDILAHAPGLAVHVWPASIGWADLGTPDRLHAWMARADHRGGHHAA